MGGIDNAVVPSVCLVAFFAFLFSVSEGGKKGKGKKEFTRKWDGRYVIGWFILLVHVGVFCSVRAGSFHFF